MQASLNIGVRMNISMAIIPLVIIPPVIILLVNILLWNNLVLNILPLKILLENIQASSDLSHIAGLV